MNITIVRNTDQTLTFTKTGDYSGDTVKFTVKADKTLTSARVIDETASVSYSSPTSTITVDLTPSDSASLSNDTYYYDLRVENSSTDRASLEDGIVYIDKSVRNDTDGASVTSTSNVTTLTGSDFNADDTLVSDGTDFIGKSVSEMKTLLEITDKIVYQGVLQSVFTDGVYVASEVSNNISEINITSIDNGSLPTEGLKLITFSSLPDKYSVSFSSADLNYPSFIGYTISSNILYLDIRPLSNLSERGATNCEWTISVEIRELF